MSILAGDGISKVIVKSEVLAKRHNWTFMRYVLAKRCKYTCIDIRCIVNWQRGANICAM
jgi:hypothetical protein